MARRPRTMWTEILPAWDHAHQAARDATHAQRSVLEAVLWLLARYQRTNDTIRLSQVAYHAGMWDGEGECGRSVVRHVGEHLRALADLGAIVYEPSRSRRGCLIGLPVSRASAAHEGDPSCATERPMNVVNMTRSTTHEPDSTWAAGRPARAPGRPARAPERRERGSTWAAEARASEGFPEGLPEGNPRGATRRRSANGSTASHAPVVVDMPGALLDDLAGFQAWAATVGEGALVTIDGTDRYTLARNPDDGTLELG